MKKFTYQARSSSGQLINDTIDAASGRDAARELAGRGFTIITLKEAAGKKSPLPGLKQLFPDRRFPVIFCRQLAVMLNAGLPASDALQLLARQDNASPRQPVIAAISATVRNGSSLSSAMQAYPQLFPPTAVALVAAGELSGKLDEILNRLAGYLEELYDAREKLITVLIYPAVLLIAALTAGIFITGFVLPGFADMFQSFHTNLPLPTRLLLTISQAVRSNFLLVAAVPLLLIGAAVFLSRREDFRLHFDRFLLRLPIFGRFWLANELYTISSTLAVLLASGIVIDKAVDSLQAVTDNYFLRQLLRRSGSDLLKGTPLSESLSKSRIIPPMFTGLLASGEATGELEPVLLKLAAYCRTDARSLSERLRIAVELGAILLAAAVIALLVFAVALPVLDSVTVLQ